MPRFDDGRIQYYCGSGESWQSGGCRSTARIKKLEAEVERLKVRLEEAVEIAEDAIGSDSCGNLSAKLDQLKESIK